MMMMEQYYLEPKIIPSFDKVINQLSDMGVSHFLSYSQKTTTTHNIKNCFVHPVPEFTMDCLCVCRY